MKRILTLLLAIVLVLSGCGIKEVTKSASEEDINGSELLKYVSYLKNEKGLFVEYETLSVYDYGHTVDTYCAVKILDCLGKLSNKEAYFEYASKISYDSILKENQDINLIYHTFLLTDLIGYELSDEVLKNLSDYFKSIQMPEGYFVDTPIIKEKILSGEEDGEKYKENLYYLSCIINLAEIYDLVIDVKGLMNILETQLFLEDETDKLAAAVEYIKAAKLWNIDIDENINSIIRGIYYTYKEKSKGLPPSGSGQISNAIELSKYLGNGDEKIWVKYYDYYFTENGFCIELPAESTLNEIFKDEKGNSISATLSAVEGYKLAGVDIGEEKAQAIADYIESKRFYDNRYIISTTYEGFDEYELHYEAMKLMYKLNSINKFKEDIIILYEKEFEDKTISTIGMKEGCELIATKYFCGEKVSDEDVIILADRLGLYLKSIEENGEYPSHTMAIIENIDVLRLFDVDIPKEIQENLITSTEYIDNVFGQSNFIAKFDSLYYKYAVYDLCKMNTDDVIKEVINYYNENYNKEYVFDNGTKYRPGLGMAQYIARILIDRPEFYNDVKGKDDMLKELYQYKDGILFALSDAYGTINQTNGAIDIIRAFNKE